MRFGIWHNHFAIELLFYFFFLLLFFSLSLSQWPLHGPTSLFRVVVAQSVRSVWTTDPATAQISPQSSLRDGGQPWSCKDTQRRASGSSGAFFFLFFFFTAEACGDLRARVRVCMNTRKEIEKRSLSLHIVVTGGALRERCTSGSRRL